MAVSLAKGGNVSLTKQAAEAGTPQLTALNVGLGWDARTTTGTDFDLDASAIGVRADGKVLNDGYFVFFNNLASPEGAITLTGDNLTGQGEGDDESVIINLALVPVDIDRIIVPVSIYDAVNRNQNFGQVRNAYIRVVDQGGNELVRYDLSEDYSTETVVIFGEVYRNGADWKFRAVGQGHNDLGGLARDHGVNI
ncbi:putative stress response protein, TerZ- and CABP1 [Frankia casuarinae]|jgi:tellurium resistance protein TerD|uniref:Stress protein n=2 Tax=Frankia casuarinae (strain DSM 45818 / CECT 9043 / HFP020203 / CcI3) TaxID=106370 RepID=Q2JGE1_FRACC|nr:MULTISPECIES: TerD family protein [Frankia]ABD09651.1 stress protein [Frankia casuarinae]ETA03644.1 putative stress response protein, TerZ- and CABP1 [Frankia sp. CcI6]EYT93685.1 putative stress response protein, TerZ- and CABP1 [Frankia casuarinae]KDA43908.1 putative stress response protein, TerZ- and CABP1 [Frankia sp. BMG5.23]KEZ37373.1 putative stress response protein, TerZ- and CABP1 [Frankia sp. CeD]